MEIDFSLLDALTNTHPEARNEAVVGNSTPTGINIPDNEESAKISDLQSLERAYNSSLLDYIDEGINKGFIATPEGSPQLVFTSNDAGSLQGDINLRQMARRLTAVHQKAIYDTEALQVELLKSVRDREDLKAVCLKAVKGFAAAVCNELLYEQIAEMIEENY